MAANVQRTTCPANTPLRERAWCGFQTAPPNLMICCCAFIMMAVATPSTPSLAQSTDTCLATNTGASASKNAAPNTNMTPTKRRRWRHQGGRHPHFGSRRVAP